MPPRTPSDIHHEAYANPRLPPIVEGHDLPVALDWASYDPAEEAQPPFVIGTRSDEHPDLTEERFDAMVDAVRHMEPSKDTRRFIEFVERAGVEGCAKALSSSLGIPLHDAREKLIEGAKPSGPPVYLDDLWRTYDGPPTYYELREQQRIVERRGLRALGFELAGGRP